MQLHEMLRRDADESAAEAVMIDAREGQAVGMTR